MSGDRVRLCIAGAILSASAVLFASDRASHWRIVTEVELFGTRGGTGGGCNIKCSKPNSCPGGPRFDCAIQCAGPGACAGPAVGTDNLPSKYCPGCDADKNGSAECINGNTFYCQRTVTCANNCIFETSGGYWTCNTLTSTGKGAPVVDKTPGGDPCP
jgi:hypothetical protein